MTRIYHASVTRFSVGIFYASWLLGTFTIAGFRSGTGSGFLFGLVSLGALGAVCGSALRRHLQPLVLIEENRVVIQRSKRQVIVQDLGTYELVINRSWLGFRRPGAQDIMIGAGELSAKSWMALVADLSALPFSRVLSAISNHGMPPTSEPTPPGHPL